MTNLLPAMEFVLFFLFSTYGLGRLVDKFVRNETKIGWAYATSLGVATWVVYGGVLNFLHGVSPLTLRYSLYIGVTLALGFVCLDLINWQEKRRIVAPSVIPNGPQIPGHQKIADSVFFSLVMGVLIFCVYYLMPANAYNSHDDFHYYLHPSLQLLSTGGFDFNLLSALGINEMGGQHFMKAFPYLYFDSQYANTFDSIICFTIALGLIIEFGKKIGTGNSIILLASIVFLLINPLVVNTSSCYSGILMIIGIIYAIYSLKIYILHHDNISNLSIIIASIPVSIFYCSIATMKSTLVVFIFVFFIFLFLFDIIFNKNKVLTIKINFTTVVISLFLLSPWLLAPSTKYLYIAQKKLMSLWMAIQKNGLTSLFSTADHRTQNYHTAANGFRTLFSTESLYWGNSYPDYMAILIALLFATGFSLYVLSKTTFTKKNRELVLVPAGALSAGACLFIFGETTDIETALRYAIPILIAVLPISILFVGKYFRNSSFPHLKKYGLALLAMHLAIGVMFTGTFIERLKRITQQRTVISFHMSSQYLDFMKYIFSGVREKEVRSAQNSIEAGKTIMSWISTPFLLDFTRNKIIPLEVCDTLGGAYDNDIPSDVDIKTFWNFFRKLGVQYILWEYAGAAVTDEDWYFYNDAPKELFFKKTLPILARYTKVIYDNNSLAVLDIREFHLTNSNAPAEN